MTPKDMSIFDTAHLVVVYTAYFAVSYVRTPHLLAGV